MVGCHLPAIILILAIVILASSHLLLVTRSCILNVMGDRELGFGGVTRPGASLPASQVVEAQKRYLDAEALEGGCVTHDAPRSVLHALMLLEQNVASSSSSPSSSNSSASCSASFCFFVFFFSPRPSFLPNLVFGPLNSLLFSELTYSPFHSDSAWLRFCKIPCL